MLISSALELQQAKDEKNPPATKVANLLLH